MSSLRLLVARVARDLLFLRPCKRCQEPFLYCGSREPGRRYCGACSASARKERERKAGQTYRKSQAGREQHRDEEAARRALPRKRAEPVGDRRCPEEEAPVQSGVAADVDDDAAEELGDATPRGETEWVLVAHPELVAAATLLLGTQVACSICHRVGVVVEVVELSEWRRSGGRIRDFG